MRRLWLWSVFIFTVAALSIVPSHSTSRAGDKSGKDQVITDELTADDPLDKVTKKHSKVHKVELAEGKLYRIDMTSKALDSFLRLEDAGGKQLALDDDGGGFPNVRILHKAKTSGEYRLIATSFDGKTGKYTITIREADGADVLQAKIQDLPNLSKEEQKQILKDFAQELNKNGGKLSLNDAQTMMKLAMSLENSNRDLAAEAYAEFGKLLAAAPDEKVASMGKTMIGAGRRVKLVGNPIEVRGNTLEGKEFDWKAYKGKVVLVDFWATWCGPCVAEVPNMKKMYELYHDRGFEIVGISLDAGKDAPTKFMESRKLPWVCLFDPEPAKGTERLSQYYGIFFIPLAILVDRDGTVVSTNARGQELDRLLEKYIGPPEKGESGRGK